MSQPPIRVGVFIPNGAQFLDVACIDSLGSMSKEYISAVASFMPDFPSEVAEHAPEVSIVYITSPEQGNDIPLTSGATLKANYTYTHDIVSPGKLDIIAVPGPDPTIEFSAGALTWLKQQAETPGVDILCICTGIFLCAAAGIAEGKTVSGPRGMQGILAKKFPSVKLVGDHYRWVQDGNLWSSGGVTNGNELIAAYARGTTRWPQPVVEMGLMLTEVGDRGQFYEKTG